MRYISFESIVDHKPIKNKTNLNLQYIIRLIRCKPHFIRRFCKIELNLSLFDMVFESSPKFIIISLNVYCTYRIIRHQIPIKLVTHYRCICFRMRSVLKIQYRLEIRYIYNILMSANMILQVNFIRFIEFVGLN